jgi:probable F420-dependent oxidoreductase
MKVFAGIPRDDIGRVPDHARWVEDMGYDGINTNEDFSSPFMALTLAAEHTSQALLGTSIAVVFPLSPMNVAYMSWELQKFSRGRFRLGMGSQVKGHIERRFSVPWVAPGPRMREYVLSLKAIWESFQNGGPLRFQGDYYNFSLITPHFSPGPIEYPPPEIFIAAVGPYMFRLAGELCDGVLPHGFMTAKYMDEVGLPNLEKGLQKSGRTLKDIQIGTGGFLVMGENEDELGAAVETARRRIAFYGSTRTYKGVMDIHGWGDVCLELNRLAAAGQWDDMPGKITDEMVETFATIGTYDQIIERVQARFGGYATQIGFTLPVEKPGDEDRLRDKVKQLQAI